MRTPVTLLLRSAGHRPRKESREAGKTGERPTGELAWVPRVCVLLRGGVNVLMCMRCAQMPKDLLQRIDRMEASKGSVQGVGSQWWRRIDLLL